MADNAIGILFEVKGGGDINGQTGKRINGQLRNLVGQINKTDTLKLKFQIDSKYIQDQIKGLQKQLQDLSGSSSEKNKSGSSGGNAVSSGYAKARKIMNDYYAAKLRYERAESRSHNIDENLTTQWKNAKEAFHSYFTLTKDDLEDQDVGVLKIRRSIEGLTEEQRDAINTFIQARDLQSNIDSANIANNAQQSWSNLTAKVHDYIKRVEYAASRNEEAAQGLKELRDMANSTDYKGYDELKKKLADVQHHINECDLATETWGQRMVKTFGSRVRSALAGIVTAKIAQYIKEVYDNVVMLDEAVVNLQIATGKTREETKKLVKEYAGLAKQLGSTTKEITAAADTWLRQGYSEEDTETLIKNSTMLSKLGQIEAEDAAKALTSAMNGYKVSVENSASIIDKFTAVDMEAAANAGDIATAMAETATSADVAGVSMDKLIGYITTVKEVTQDGAESVGTFYKTLFARMNNVSAGKFVDDETGESLNDVETVLNELGIALRDSNNEFRKSGEVLDEVASRWNKFDTVEQHAIATAIAGTRQQEKFIVLMENYGDALKYANVASESAGTATEKFKAHLDGIDGKMSVLKASFEELSMTVLDSDLVIDGIEFITWLLKAITLLVDKLGGLNVVLYITAGLVLTIKLDSIVGIVTKLIGLIPLLITKIVTFSTALKTARTHGSTLGSSLSAAFNSIGITASTAQIAVGAFVAVLGVALIAIDSIKQMQEKNVQTAINTSQAYISESKAAKEDADSLDVLIKKYEELAEKNNGVWDDKTAETVKGIQDEITSLVGDQASSLNLVNGELKTELGILKKISEESKSIALEKAQSALTDAKVAVQSSMGKWRTGDNMYFDIGVESNKTYGRVKTETAYRSAMGVTTLRYDTIKTKFDTAEEFAEQYEAVREYKNFIAQTVDETNALEVEFYNELNEYLEEYKDVYDAYASARDLISKLTDVQGPHATKGTVVALKSTYDILEEVREGYDGLASALSDVTSEGYLTADALSTILKLESDNALAGLKLSDILTQEANGYKLAGSALEKYITNIVEAQKARYDAISVFASAQDKQNALDNISAYIGVLTALVATTEYSVDASKEQREALKAEQEMYENQRDAFEELIDIRKELLRTYADEVAYQREIEKKQRTVSSLRQKLSVARLDNSASGQARVRELEAELDEAQNDLDDFTLEHAIDVLTAQLDSESVENEAFFQRHLDRIEGLLEGLDTAPDVNVDIDTSWATDLIQVLGDIKLKLEKDDSGDTGIYGPAPPPSYGAEKTRWTKYTDAVAAGYSVLTGPQFSRGEEKKKYGTYQAYLDAMYLKYIGKSPEYHSGGFVGGSSALQSNEEFAKLLKHEFVSTPAQMQHFMEDTLPKIANYTPSGGNNEFNAPLIEIRCNNVTADAMPELKMVVDEAVKEIQRQLDSGMSRTGFKKQIPHRLL